MTRRRGLTLLWVAGLIWACTPKPAPGDENLGLYSLTATPAVLEDGGLDRDCQLTEVKTNPISFEATLSRNSDGTGAWMTLSGVSRDASWDGRVFSSTASAPRFFSVCGSCTTSVVETIELALLSSSQAQRVGNACPAHPLDGGVPTPDPDAGIFAPANSDAGFDALLACGELRTALVAGDGGTAADGGTCDICRVCTMRFDVTGARR